jgi:hypothetical protein
MAVGTSTSMPTNATNCSRRNDSQFQNSGVGAAENGTHHGARALLGVIADGQDDGVLEGLAQSREAPAMRQAVGNDRDDDAGDDAEQAEERPDANDQEGALTTG